MLKNKINKKLKIVIFVSYTYPYLGSGIGNVALMQAENLAALGHKVDLVSSNVPRTNSEFYKNKVRHLKMNSNTFLERFSVPVPLFLFNTKVIDSIKNADIVHAHGMLYPSSFQAALLTKMFRKSFVLTQHAGYIKYSSHLINLLQSLVQATAGKIILELSDRVIVVNKYVKNWLNIGNKKIITLINGVDKSLFYSVNNKKKKAIREKYNLPINKNIVMHLGRLVSKKGYQEMFEARDGGYKIIIVGKGRIPKYMRKKRKNILFLGGVPQGKLGEIYQASDIFVLPSKCEGLPLSIQEAMASGLPIITTRHPGFERYLDERYVTFINPSAKETKKAIKNVLGNKQLMQKMSRYSKNAAIAKMSWKKNAESLLKVYKETL